MATLLEMAGEIVMAHASTNAMSKDELLKELQEVYAALVALEKGEEVGAAAVETKPAMTAKKSIGKNTITCLICGESMKTLTRHLMSKHNLKPGAYRKQFGISSKQSLAAKSYSESRRQMALDKNLGAGLAKARAARAVKKAAAPKVAVKAAAPKAAPAKAKKAAAKAKK